MGIFGGAIRRMFGRAETVACIFFPRDKDAVNQTIILTFCDASTRKVKPLSVWPELTAFSKWKEGQSKKFSNSLSCFRA